MNSKEENRVISGVLCLFMDHVVFASNWGCYLELSDFDGEPELRNKIMTLWMASLMDPLVKEAGWLNDYRDKVNKLGLIHLLPYIEQAKYFFKSMKNHLAQFSKDEQIFIAAHRNKLAHGFLAGRHGEQQKLTYLDGGQVKQENMNRDELEPILYRIYSLGDLDDTLGQIRERFMKDSEYWRILREVFSNRDAIHKAIYERRKFQFKNIPV